MLLEGCGNTPYYVLISPNILICDPIHTLMLLLGAAGSAAGRGNTPHLVPYTRRGTTQVMADFTKFLTGIFDWHI